MSRSVTMLPLLLLLLSSCFVSENRIQEYRHINSEGWYVDSLVHFVFPVSDVSKPYRIDIGLRYTDDYAYSNLWLFITTISPDTVMTTDTLQIILADEYGRWLGSGVGERVQQEITYRQTQRFDTPGDWHLFIQQGMRDDCLQGITDVGLKVKSE